MASEPEAAEATGPAEGEPWEARLPPGQRWINRFCENWIFAFIVAMAVRHFAIEAYRIPTASMEPMLYGDPAFSRADHVVVDKLVSRFTDPDRWDVTVFQFPWPEVMSPPNPEGKRQPIRAWDAAGERVDRFPTRPLLYRNFVKRAVILPGDAFYISGGDVYLAERDPDGAITGWTVPPKPHDVQEALWQAIYRHGAEEGYLPWDDDGGGARVAAEGGVLLLELGAGGRLRFTQPLTNMYIKPGTVQVQYRGPGDQPSALVDVSMVEPLFDYVNAQGRLMRDNLVWNLDDWNVRRLTTADLDNPKHGRLINDVVEDHVGDFRITFDLVELEGRLAFELREGPVERPIVAVDLALDADGWAFTVQGAVVARGDGSPVGHRWSVINCDNRVRLLRDGEAVPLALEGAKLPEVPVPPTDPSDFDERTSMAFSGAGAARIADLAIERDLHYSREGFLANQRASWPNVEVLKMREQILPHLLDPAQRDLLLADLAATSDGLPGARSRWLLPVGISPETALQAPENGYLMLGDNSTFSWDGRNWGWVPAANLRGEVLAVVLPPSRWRIVR